MLDDAQLVDKFPLFLRVLKNRISLLPKTLPTAPPDSPLRFLATLEIDAEEGAWFSANRGWERAFQCAEADEAQRLVCGPHGLDLVCQFLEFYAEADGIKGTTYVGALVRRIHDLNKLMDRHGMPIASLDTSSAPADSSATKTNLKRKTPSADSDIEEITPTPAASTRTSGRRKDPLLDKLVDRWTEKAFGTGKDRPFHRCVACRQQFSGAPNKDRVYAHAANNCPDMKKDYLDWALEAGKELGTKSLSVKVKADREENEKTGGTGDPKQPRLQVEPLRKEGKKQLKKDWDAYNQAPD
ncbi:hypothetical protein B0H10DRAFT_2297509 [Mycena sp. CBHHK59/15]|nr:hypothetical protein B0H10DRAFT_2297509 [Mycena sp. CBHHK59/15]